MRILNSLTQQKSDKIRKEPFLSSGFIRKVASLSLFVFDFFTESNRQKTGYDRVIKFQNVDYNSFFLCDQQSRYAFG